jgi:hypothetical protein
VDEVGELDLGDGPVAGQRQTDADADDRRLGQRRVHHAVVAERGGQAVGGPEDTPPGADVLTEDEDPLVGGHQLVLGLAHGVDDGALGRRTGHRRLGRARLRRIADALGDAPERPQRAGEDLGVGGRRLGEGLGLGGLGRGVDLGPDLGLDAVLVGLGQQALLDEVLLHAPQRVLLPPGLDLLRRAVGAVVVVGRVGHVAVGLALDEGRPLAVAGPADGRVHGGVDVEGVVPVDDHTAEAVAVGPVGDVVDRRLLRQRDRDGVAVVLADEDARQAVDAGEVERLVEVALRRRPLTEVADHHLALLAQLGRVGEAGGVGELRGDGGRAGDDVELGRAPVVRHLAAARVRVIGPGEHGEQHLLGGHAEGEDDPGVAVVRQHDVAAGLERPGRSDLRALVTLGAHDEGRLAHPVEAPDLLVQEPAQQDEAVHPHQIVTGEAVFGVPVVQVERREVVDGRSVQRSGQRVAPWVVSRSGRWCEDGARLNTLSLYSRLRCTVRSDSSRIDLPYLRCDGE